MNSKSQFCTLVLSGLLLWSSCSSDRAGNVSPQNIVVPSPAADTSTTADTDLCELLQFPERFERKNVRVKGYYCDCFENARLYAENCPVQNKIWVEGPMGKCSKAGRVDPFRAVSGSGPENSFGSWTFGVIVQGRLTGTKGGYGHMNQYSLLFEADCLEYAELLDRSGKPPSAMTGEQQRKSQAFERLK